MKHLFILTLSIIISHTLAAQLLVDDNHTAAELVEQLVGAGLSVDPTSIELSCPQQAYGSFIGSETNLGLDEGIILTTGTIQNAIGPNTVGNLGDTSGGNVGDTELESISGVDMLDVCYLVFDFIPQGDTLTFSYVFGSEEYDDYVCSDFNDAFGFFIRGGTEYPSYNNLTILPGTTDMPVTINTVNGGTANYTSTPCVLDNTEFYVANSALPTTTIQYDGFTTVLSAGCAVTPCETYTFKIAIGDGFDTGYDSGVFLEGNSFSTNGVQVTASTTAPVDYETAVEGCVDGIFTFTFDEPVSEETVVHFEFQGTAQNGGPNADFDIPVDSLVVPVGDSTATLVLAAFDDGVDEGPESLSLILKNDGCAGAGDTIDFYILEGIVVSATPDNLVACPGDEIPLVASGAGLYTWEPADAVDNPFVHNPVANVQESTILTVTGQVGSCSAVATVEINIDDDYDPYIQPEYEVCEGGSVQLEVEGGSFFFWCVWDDVFDDWNCANLPDNLSCTDCPNPVFSDGYEEQLAVIVIDGIAGCRDTITTNIVLGNGEFLTSEITDTLICHGESLQINTSGGTDFQWSPAEGLSCTDCPNPLANPGSSTSYQLISQLGTCADTIEVQVNVAMPQIALGEDIVSCEDLITEIGVEAREGYSYQWSPDTGLQDSNAARTELEISAQNGRVDENYILKAVDSNGCATSDEIRVLVVGDPGLSINAPDSIVQGNIVSLSAAGLDENSTYQWSGGTGTLTAPGSASTSARPLVSTEYILTGTDENGCIFETTHFLTVILPPRFLVPSAFSPNGDSVNDVLMPLTYDVDQLISFQVFDRWGQLVYDNTGDLNQGWDGTLNGELLPMGVYVYFAEFKTNGSDEVYQVKGNSTLIR